MALPFRPRPQNLIRCQRPFSTSTPRSISLQWEKNKADALADIVPAYPHGPTRWYKQSRLGLYGGQRIQFGNNVGQDSEVKTRRAWHPNVVTRKLYSKSLHRHVQVRVTVRVLRTIDKLGGLDEYLLGEKEARIKALGESGWWLRWAVMQTPAVRKRFAEERARLGLSAEEATDAKAEVEEAEALVSDATPAESDAAIADDEQMPTDGAFQLETTPELPPLKFRVGPNKHLVLTSQGWRRTRPGTFEAARRVRFERKQLIKRASESIFKEKRPKPARLTPIQAAIEAKRAKYVQDSTRETHTRLKESAMQTLEEQLKKLPSEENFTDRERERLFGRTLRELRENDIEAAKAEAARTFDRNLEARKAKKLVAKEERKARGRVSPQAEAVA